MVILNDNFIREIDEYKGKIDGSRMGCFVHLMFDNFARETIKNASIQDRDNEKRKEEVIRDFQVAWDYSIANYPEEFNLEYLTDIAGRVEPSLRLAGQDYAEIRREGGIALPGVKYVPPVDGDRVRVHLDRMSRAIREFNFHPVEEAIFLYFHLARIQPFQNGNKRTANIIMNTTLLKQDLAPISIPPEEVPRFNGYFGGALHGFREDGAHGEEMTPYIQIGRAQRQLYDYLARRERTALLLIEDHLKGLHRYDIFLESKDPNSVYFVKKKLDAWCRHNNQPHRILLDPKHRELELIGDIPLAVIQKILAESRGVRKFSIENNGVK